MLLRLTAICVGLLVCDGGVTAAGQTVILDADRYIKTGTRIPELPAGQGGELHIDAPQELCRDATYLLEVRFFPDNPPEMMPVVRLTAGPSACTWLFERMPVGRYEALIQTPQEERIVCDWAWMALEGHDRGSRVAACRNGGRRPADVGGTTAFSTAFNVRRT